MGLCKTSNFSVFTFITARDLKFCTRFYSSCVCTCISHGKVCKMMMSHFCTLNYHRLLTHAHMAQFYLLLSGLGALGWLIN